MLRIIGDMREGADRRQNAITGSVQTKCIQYKIQYKDSERFDRAYGIQLCLLRVSYCSFNIFQLFLMGPKLKRLLGNLFRNS